MPPFKDSAFARGVDFFGVFFRKPRFARSRHLSIALRFCPVFFGAAVVFALLHVISVAPFSRRPLHTPLIEHPAELHTTYPFCVFAPLAVVFVFLFTGQGTFPFLVPL